MTELQMLREYFIASEKKRLIGQGEHLANIPYRDKVGLINELTDEISKISGEISVQTNLHDFLKRA